ncbi:hypothetical protein RHGRI_013491 [Rhododendron griersonianum]|uniref:NAD-dependent epimerase/dehydratase domain-containing protein n=1 Tax=Rhododendron griersonianum TaxID=479676 RepID=A0AAV6K5R9_9ERIC|nr:hypothetical protein RHGRI_013491 [Rhododendron griersonianum]
MYTRIGLRGEEIQDFVRKQRRWLCSIPEGNVLSEKPVNWFSNCDYASRIVRCACSICIKRAENQMTVSITGATGFIGRRLVQRLHADNHRVRVLTRSRSNAQLIFPVREFPGIVIAEEPKWKECIQGSNAVVNLAGMPISTRWSPEVSSSNLFDYLDCAFYATSKK